MSLDVSSERFEAEVIQASHRIPVLVDFWAEWCGPCRMLGPVLERAEADYAGRFVLAKVNTDHNQAIAARYKISGIPAVKLFLAGKVLAEFTGALPDQVVRRFLDQHLPHPELQNLLKEEPFAAAQRAALVESGSPERWKIIWAGAVAGLLSGRTLAEIEPLLDLLQKDGDRLYQEYALSLGHLLKKFELAGSAADHVRLGLQGKPEGLEFFLDRVRLNARDKAVRDDFLALLKLMPEPDIANRFRRELAALIF